MRKQKESLDEVSEENINSVDKILPEDIKIPFIYWYDSTTQLIFLLYIISDSLKIITFFEALVLFFGIFILVMLLKTVFAETNNKIFVQKAFINSQNLISMLTFVHFIIQSIYLINIIYYFTFQKIMEFYYDNFVLSITISFNIYAIVFLLFILYELKRFLWALFRPKETLSKSEDSDYQTNKTKSLVSSITILFLFIYFWLEMSTENILVFYFTFLYYLNLKVVGIFIRLSGKNKTTNNTFNSDLVTKMLSLLSVIFILYLKSFSLYLESKLNSVC